MVGPLPPKPPPIIIAWYVDVMRSVLDASLHDILAVEAVRSDAVQNL